MLANGLYKLGRQIVKNSRIIEKTGKPNIPRFLYHITSKENYSAMLKDGMIKTSADVSPVSELNGVFMFDMKNIAKRWTNTWIDVDNFHVNLGTVLMTKNSVAGVKDVVLLKIPTKNMNINKLKIRPQLKDTINADSAIYQSIYTRRKNPIEYIYEENIDISNVQKLGESTLKYASEEDWYKKLRKKPTEILLQLLKGQPEAKGVKIFAEHDIKPKTLLFD